MGAYFAYCIKRVLILELTALITAISVLITFLFLCILAIPMHLYRFMLLKTFKFFRPDLDTLLKPGQNIFAALDDFDKPQYTLMAKVNCTGNIKVEEIRQLYTDKVIAMKTKKGKLKYPEMGQYPSNFMGYIFWKTDTKFDVTNHIKYLSSPDEEKVYSEEDVSLLQNEMMTKPYVKNRSMWEVFVIPNVKTDSGLSSVILFVIHHCYGDGYSFMNMLYSDVCGYSMDDVAKPKYEEVKRNILQKLFFYITLPFLAIYDFLRPGILGNINSAWQVPFWKLKRDMVSAKPLLVPLDVMKSIKNKYNCALGSVILSGFVGAMRKSALNRNVKLNYNITVSCPVPLKNHPGDLDIHAGVLNFIFPLEEENPVLRLKAINEYTASQKKSRAIGFILALKSTFGSFSPIMIRLAYPLIPTAAFLNILPGPTFPCSILGYDVTDFSYTFGQTTSYCSTCISCFTYNDHLSIKSSVNTAVFKTTEEVEEFNSFLKEEYEFLANHQVVKSV